MPNIGIGTSVVFLDYLSDTFLENIDVQIRLLNKINTTGQRVIFPIYLFHKGSTQYRNRCGFNTTFIFATDNVSRFVKHAYIFPEICQGFVRLFNRCPCII